MTTEDSSSRDNYSGPGQQDRKATAKSYKLPTEERLIRSAIHYLDRYSSSLENLRKVLFRKVKRAAMENQRSPEEFRELVDRVVEKCQRAGMVDDNTYAETKLAGLRRRGRSKRQIEAMLVSKGVDRQVIASVIGRDETPDLEAAQIYARKRKLGPWRPHGQRHDYLKKDIAALCRAGYSFEIARKVIEAVDDGDVSFMSC